ncbi:acyl-CoA dehydrogenase [Variovorax paradoxus]|uniref:acyl-CoA dehydrogenase n=1 Tax=Variovorax paradoxus TaxID=34073 RepID=UPI00278AE1A2|nr:acyl-CoA dehydrogenase [Variovorax paradoxus]MDQ0591173.1 alkylation response protein AidB-like acyl-CoA dehydrogenase [Variovorax paradoxus]
MSLRPTLDFLLYDWLDAESLNQRERFADHSRETFDAVLDTCERIAREKYAPANRIVDTQEPHFDGEKVVLPQATHDAHKAFVESGMMCAAQDYEIGGMQLPYTLQAAANSFFAMASVSIGSNMLTSGNANLLMVHGTQMQKEVFAKNEFSGRWAGTMCLSEPQAGSSLSDVATRAVPDGADYQSDPLGPRYRLTGNKMWISAGDHELTENIVHIVLAKIPDENGKLVPGTRGISLFIVPKWLVNVENPHSGPFPQAGEGEVGSVKVTLGSRNDVALAGLNHKLGWRGTTNTLLNFGEGKYPVGGKAGAVGYLVGEPGKGLHCMFHMMNEARIGVGTAATMLGMAGYHASLEYAKTRPQGRLVKKPQTAGTAGVKDSASPQVRIIEHADVRRMLLAQKAYCEGALALELYCARLVDEQKTGDAEAADDARLLLEVLTPVAKSWPSEWCLEANSLAIQVHGGYGYTRDFPVEQYWRDNRLNMIHEGTHGIQAADLLGRKVLMEKGRGLQLLGGRIAETIGHAARVPALAAHARVLEAALQRIGSATEAAWSTGDPVDALANAVPYMQAFGHTVLAWIWLDVARRALEIDADKARAVTAGKIGATDYFFHYELPKIGAWLNVVESRDPTCTALPEDAF